MVHEGLKPKFVGKWCDFDGRSAVNRLVQTFVEQIRPEKCAPAEMWDFTAFHRLLAERACKLVNVLPTKDVSEDRRRKRVHIVIRGQCQKSPKPAQVDAIQGPVGENVAVDCGQTSCMCRTNAGVARID